MTRRSKGVLASLFGLFAVVLVFILVFDFNWLRVPVQNYISKKTQREFRMSHLAVKLGRYPRVILNDVFFQNADWSKEGPMAKIGKLEFTVSLRDLWDHKVVLPRLALSNADITMEELADGRKNWTFSDPNDKSATVFRVSTLSVDHGKLHYVNHGPPFDLTINADTVDTAQAADVTNASKQASNRSLTTRYIFGGKYRDAGFNGQAFTGDVLTFQESKVPFPIRGNILAGTTRLDVDGSVADVVHISAIDTQLHISGKTLANLYPFLLLPLPASPPYDIKGRLKMNGDHFAMDNLVGRIGETDINGRGTYERRQPRPLLSGELHSKLLNIADLGPLVGLKTRDTGGAARPTQAGTATREAASGGEHASGGDKVLPTGTFDTTRLRAIDADVTYEAGKVLGPQALALETFYASLHVHDAQLRLTPLQFGFAGGRIISTIALDARGKPLKGKADIDFRHVEVAKLFPSLTRVVKGEGLVGAQIRLRGEGDNVAALVGSSSGTVAAAIADGRISNLLDAMVSLNGGRAIPAFLTKDHDIPIRCGGAAFDVTNGEAKSTLMVLDTEQTRIDGEGTVDLKNEKFDITFSPKPKHPGILSLRTPLRVYGSFRHPDYALDKKVLALRAGGALALAVVSPIAMLLPLLETGPGKDTDCAAVLDPVQGARQEASSQKVGAPKPVAANRPKAASQLKATGDPNSLPQGRERKLARAPQ
ncbi:MAG TPA: AsmA family protein [Burkholderiales bacterium]|nr:AsmA family protein [Burkholderiales bacterium]